VIIILTMSAFLLRGPGITKIPPGVWVDEAVEGLQAGTANAGERLPNLADSNLVYPRWPVWWTLERVAVHFGGMTVSATRVPAVIVGTLAVPLAWWVVRSLFGPLAGLVSASFLAFSFWHIQLSRIGVAPVLLVPEVLIAGWLLLSRRIHRFRLAGLGVGALCVVACLDYPASFALPVWAVAVALLRIVFPERTSRDRAYGFWILGGLLAFGILLYLFPGINLSARLGRTNAVGLAPFMDMAAQAVRTLSNHLIPVANSLFIWDGFPPGAPRFSPVENFAWLAGIACVLVLPGLPMWSRLGLVLGFPVLLLPEILPGTSGGIYLVRGVASLGLVSVLAGIGARVWGPAAGRAGLGALVVVSAISAWYSGWITYGPFARSDLSKRIYSGVAVEVAEGIRALLMEKPVAVFPPLSYVDNPQIAFHLWNDIRAGRIKMAGAPPKEDRAIGVFRDPVGKQPLVILVVSHNFTRDRIVGLLDVQATMMEGLVMQKAGKLREAEETYRIIAKLIPDYWPALGELWFMLLQQGRKQEANIFLKEIEKYRPRAFKLIDLPGVRHKAR